MNVHRFALVTTGATFLLLLIGGLVHATDAGLACGQVWPSCDGTWFPAMTGGVAFEHTHRIVAGTVGLLTLALAIWVWRKYPDDRLLRAAGIFAVGLVFFQAMLGRKTVLEGLPPWVSASHLATGMAFFCLLIWISLRTRTGMRRRRATPAALRHWVGIATGAVYAQIVLGAAVRHLDAGVVCTTFPLCDGALWPAGAILQVHMAHRILGVIVAVLVVVATILTVRTARHNPLVNATVRAASVLVFVQIFLGVLSVLTALTPWIVTAHLAVGAGLLALMMTTWVFLGEAAEILPEQRAAA